MVASNGWRIGNTCGGSLDIGRVWPFFSHFGFASIHFSIIPVCPFANRRPVRSPITSDTDDARCCADPVVNVVPRSLCSLLPPRINRVVDPCAAVVLRQHQQHITYTFCICICMRMMRTHRTQTGRCPVDDFYAHATWEIKSNTFTDPLALLAYGWLLFCVSVFWQRKYEWRMQFWGNRAFAFGLDWIGVHARKFGVAHSPKVGP